MAKNDLLKRNDQRPVVAKGELVPVATVVQIDRLTVAGPYSGDFQIKNGGRLIVGEDPDSGARVIIGSYGQFGYSANGTQTFSLYNATVGTHTPGDLHLGNLAQNYLLYQQSTGTLGLYTPQGAGFIARRDGTLQAGHADGAHMLWNAADAALQVRYADDVKINLGADGNASFDGTIYAAGGRIYGTLAVDDVLRAGDVDGPAVYLGRFERDTGTETIRTAEIIATDDKNLPWFHVVAGGETLPGYFHLGGTGDYDQHLSYDGVTLELDGTVHARSGSFAGSITAASGVIGGWTINADNLQSADLAVKLSATGGIVLDSLIGLYDSAGIKWSHGGTDHFRLGIELDEGVVTWAVVESSGVLKVRGDGIVIAPYDGHSLVLGNSGIDTTNQISLSATTIAVNGTLTWKPITNSTTALQLQNAAGTAIVNIDAVNKRVGINQTTPDALLTIKAAGYETLQKWTDSSGNFYGDVTWNGNFRIGKVTPGRGRLELGPTSGSVEQLFGIFDNNSNSRFVIYSDGGFYVQAEPSTAGSVYKVSPAVFLMPTQWNGSSSVVRDALQIYAQPFADVDGYGTFYFRNSVRNTVPLAIGFGSYGQVGIGSEYPASSVSEALKSYGKLLVKNDQDYPICTFIQANGQTDSSIEVQTHGGDNLFVFDAYGAFYSYLRNASTNTADNGLVRSHNSSGTPTTGFGIKDLWRLESSTTENCDAAELSVAWTDATHATRTAHAVLKTTKSGTLVEVASLGGSSGIIVNEGGESWCDFRVEGDTAANLFFVDASADAVGIGTDAPVTRLHVRQTSGDTSSSRNLLSMGHNSTGTPAAGFGAGILLALKSDSTADREAGLIEAAWSTATDASRKADLILSAYDTGKREGLRIQGNGAAAAIGLYGAAPVVQATTSVAAASFTANSGTAINDASTFDGYTIKQIVRALRLLGALA